MVGRNFVWIQVGNDPDTDIYTLDIGYTNNADATQINFEVTEGTNPAVLAIRNYVAP